MSFHVPDHRTGLNANREPVYRDSPKAFRRAESQLRPVAGQVADLQELREALRELRINANRLCDRNHGGTYEADCRRSIARADAALKGTA